MKRLGSLLFYITACLLVGAAGGLVTQASIQSWYAFLIKPALTPPNAVFAPVWTSLYVCMAVAGWKMECVEPAHRSVLRRLFWGQLLLNGAWSFLFFGLRNPWIGLIDIVLLWVCLLVLMRATFVRVPGAAWLLLPYFLWVSFATYLNGAIAWLNR